jgi:dienelactone hydrolase
MTRQNVEFRTSDHVTLRGWLYTNDGVTGKVPCIVMCSGMAGIKEMRLDAFAEYFVAKLPVCCLLFDHRGWGESDVLAGQPRNETIPMTQCSDISDAITFASTLEQVTANKIGIWGSSYSGGHVLYVGAVDKRVKLVLSQVPMVSGWNSSERALPTDAGPIMSTAFANGMLSNHICQLPQVINQIIDRIARLQGKEPGYVPVADIDPSKQAMFSSPATCDFFAPWIDSGKWQNRITIKSYVRLNPLINFCALG